MRVLLEHNRLTVPDLGPRPCLGAYAQVNGPGAISLHDRAVLH